MKLWRTRPATGPARSFVIPEDPFGIETYAALLGATASGQTVTPERALRVAAVTACIRVLTTTAATLPVDAVRSDGNRRRPITPTPPIVAAPSATVSRRGWVAQVMRGMLMYGNVYGQIVRYDGDGFPLQVETLPNKSVKVTDTDVIVDGKPQLLWPLGPIVHIPATAFLRPGSPVADSPAVLARESIGTSLAAEEFGARFFGDSAHPNVILRANKELTRDQAQGIKDRIKSSWVGREPAVVGSGLEVDFPTTEKTAEAFLDLIRFEVEQTCRFFGVPPAMVYAAVSGQNVTYANITDADNQYLKHSAGIWLSDVEDVWSTFLPGDHTSVKFNVDAFLRMDAKGRHSLYNARLRAKTITVNEVRALEDEEPFQGPEWDEPGVPGGITPAPLQEDEQP